MIVSKIRGGLGNQLFTYAAGRSLSLTHELPLVLDVSWYATGDRTLLLHAFSIAGSFSEQDHSGEVDGVGFNQEDWGYHPSFEHVDGFRFLSGWWQSERFFDRHRQVIRGDLTLKDLSVWSEADRVVASVPTMGAPLVSVHCRRGDYVQLAEQDKFRLLDADYFRSAMELFPSDHEFLVFSDDPDWARNALAGPRITVADVSDTLTAFAAMQRCHHHIISNSSFSWWAAWLSEGPTTRVVAPPTTHWFGPEFSAIFDTRDVVPSRWTQMPVESVS